METESRGNDVDESSNAFYEVEKPSEVYNTYQKVISSENIQVMVKNILEGMQCLTLGNIYAGSMLLDRKAKSLTQIWFTKCKVIDNKEGKRETKNGMFIRRHTIVSFECVYGIEKIG